MPIDLRAAIAEPPARPKRLVVSTLERNLVAPRHAWAIRSVYLARLEASGVRVQAPLSDCWLLPRMVEA